MCISAKCSDSPVVFLFVCFCFSGIYFDFWFVSLPPVNVWHTAILSNKNMWLFSIVAFAYWAPALFSDRIGWEPSSQKPSRATRWEHGWGSGSCENIARALRLRVFALRTSLEAVHCTKNENVCLSYDFTKLKLEIANTETSRVSLHLAWLKTSVPEPRLLPEFNLCHLGLYRSVYWCECFQSCTGGPAINQSSSLCFKHANAFSRSLFRTLTPQRWHYPRHLCGNIPESLNRTFTQARDETQSYDTQNIYRKKNIKIKLWRMWISLAVFRRVSRHFLVLFPQCKVGFRSTLFTALHN